MHVRARASVRKRVRARVHARMRVERAKRAYAAGAADIQTAREEEEEPAALRRPEHGIASHGVRRVGHLKRAGGRCTPAACAHAQTPPAQTTHGRTGSCLACSAGMGSCWLVMSFGQYMKAERCQACLQ
eukprot:6208022-Pleurochrysis_carterae.AAC.5